MRIETRWLVRERLADALCVLLSVCVLSKSSLINSLTRERSAAVGNMPGLTKTLQTIALDGHIKLIDSPGVMFSGGRSADGSVDGNMILRNCLRFEQLEDPVGVVYKIVERCTEHQLRECYDLGPMGQDAIEFDADQFLIQVAHKRGKLGRGGVPDLAAAAKIVIKDWNDGKIAYCSEPPSHADDFRGEAQVVQAFAPEINRKDPLAAIRDVRVEVDEADRQRVEALARAQAEAASHPLGSRPLYEDVTAAAVEGEVEMGDDGEPRSSIVTRPRQAAAAAASSAQAEDDDEDESGMAEESAAASTYAASSSSAAAAAPSYSAPRPKAANAHNPQSNQQSKKKQKSTKKKMRKTANRAAAAAGAPAAGDMEHDGADQGSADIALDDDQDL